MGHEGWGLWQGKGSATEKNKNHSLYFHKLGTPQSADVLAHDHPVEPELMVFVQPAPRRTHPRA